MQGRAKPDEELHLLGWNIFGASPLEKGVQSQLGSTSLVLLGKPVFPGLPSTAPAILPCGSSFCPDQLEHH